jgi:hypothetical protein
LESDRHLVIFVQHLVEALPSMRFQLYIVGESSPEQAACCQEHRGSREPHGERLKLSTMTRRGEKEIKKELKN